MLYWGKCSTLSSGTSNRLSLSRLYALSALLVVMLSNRQVMTNFRPIVEVTEGNPLLIKLFVTRLLMSHLPLAFVLAELKAVNQRLGRNIIDYLYADLFRCFNNTAARTPRAGSSMPFVRSVLEIV